MPESKKITFKDYYESLPLEGKLSIRDKMVPYYINYITFYSKIKKGTFTKLELEKLEEITGEKFESQ